jgi:hypothetical protein
MSDTEHRFTRDEVSTAVNAGVQLILDDNEISLSDRDYDLVNLVVNAGLSMLDNPPPRTPDEVIERNYQPDLKCVICGGRLIPETGENGENGEYSGRYTHSYTMDNDHDAMPAKTADIVRGWINSL